MNAARQARLQCSPDRAPKRHDRIGTASKRTECARKRPPARCEPGANLGAPEERIRAYSPLLTLGWNTYWKFPYKLRRISRISRSFWI